MNDMTDTLKGPRAADPILTEIIRNGLVATTEHREQLGPSQSSYWL